MNHLRAMLSRRAVSLVFICLVLGIPHFFFFAGLRSWWHRLIVAEGAIAFSLADRHIESLQTLSQDGAYYARILERVHRNAERSASPQAYLAAVEKRLTRVFGPVFAMQAWDSSGQALLKGTKNQFDDPGWQQEFWRVFSLEGLVDPALRAARIQRIRDRVGTFLSASSLQDFVQGRKTLIPCSREEDRRYCWFRGGERIRLFCFLDQKAFGRHLGLKRMVALSNLKLGDRLATALFKVPDFWDPVTDGKAIRRDEFIRGMRRFRENLEPQVTTDAAHLLFRQVGAGVWLAAGKSRAYQDSDVPGLILQLQLITLLLLCAAGSYGFMRVFPESVNAAEGPYVSVTWKILGVFLVAYGVPAAGFLLVMTESFSQQREIALLGRIQEVEKQVRVIDQRFPSFYPNLEKRLNRHLRRLEGPLSGPRSGWTLPLEAFHQALGKMLPERFALISSGTSFLCSNARIYPPGVHLDSPSWQTFPELITFPGFKLYAILANGLLEKFNGQGGKTNLRFAQFETMAKDTLNRSAEEMINDLVRNRGRFQTVSLSRWFARGFWNLLRNPRTAGCDFFFVGFWDATVVESLFLETCIGSQPKEPSGLRLHSYSNTRNGIFHSPPGDSFPGGVLPLLRRAFFKKATVARVVTMRGMPYLVAILPGREMKGSFLIATIPLGRMQEDLRRRKLLLPALFLLALAIGLQVALSLGNRVIAPVQDLAGVAAALDRRDFAFRVEIDGGDEIGQLGDAFNQVMEGMAELAVASGVQKTFFPPVSVAWDGFQFLGRTEPMGELGGDYLDLLRVAPHCCGVVAGDVTGHGVPAALVMSLAKGAVWNQRSLWEEPVQILKEINQTLLHAQRKKKHVSRMSCMYLLADGKKEMVHIANSGQCSPISISGSGDRLEYIGLPSTLLGISANMRNREIHHPMAPGDCLVLYSDGAVEVRNEQGETLGYDAWLEQVRKSWNPDAAVFFESLWRFHRAFRGAASPADDVTIILLKRTHRSTA